MCANSYLTFPIHLLKFHSEERKKTYDNIEEAINTGIEYFIRRTNWNYEDVVRQVCYDFLRNRDNLRSKLDSTLTDMIEEDGLDLFDDKEAFYEDEFYPEEAMNQLKAKMKEDGDFKELCLQHYYKHLIVYILDVIPANFLLLWDKSIKDAYKTKNTPMVSINISWVFDARDGKIPLEVFRLVCAVISIIGKKICNNQSVYDRELNVWVKKSQI